MITEEEKDNIDIGYYKNRPKKEVCWRFLLSFCAVCLAMLIVALGYFSFSSPDPISCYYMPGLESPATKKDDLLKLAQNLQIQVKDEYLVDMARVFRIWFVWGFWTTLLPCVLCLIMFILSYVSKLQRSAKIATWTLCGLMTVGMIAWIIIGVLWRFSKPGRVVAGDFLDNRYKDDRERVRVAQVLHGYQVQGGKFMRDFFLLGIPFFTTLMVGGLIMICFIETGDELEDERKERREHREKLKEARKLTTYADEKHVDLPNTFRGLARSERDSIMSTDR